MKKPTKITNRLTKVEKALMFVRTNTMHSPRQVVGVSGLYGAYLKHTIRFAKPISKERFVRILDRNGYRRNGGLLNGLLMDLTYERGY